MPRKPAVVEPDHPKGLLARVLAVSPDGTLITYGAVMDKPATLAVWKLPEVVRLRHDSRKRKDVHLGLALSPDGSLAAIFDKKGVEIWDVVKLKRTKSLPFDWYTGNALAWSDGNALLVAGSHSGTVTCWNGDTGRILANLKLNAGVKHVAFLPDNRHVVCAVIENDKGRLLHWDIQKNRVVRSVPLPEVRRIPVHAVSRDRTALVSTDHFSAVALLTNLQTLKTTRFKLDFKKHCTSLALSDDKKQLAAAFHDGTVRVWNVTDGTLVYLWKKPRHRSIDAIAFSPDGQQLAVSIEMELAVLDFRAKAVSRTADKSLPAGVLNCVHVDSSRECMDRAGLSWGCRPMNPLPVKCAVCEFPDLDFVPREYLLARDIDNPRELAPSDRGDFFVREQARRVLETVAPRQCRFYPTLLAKTGKLTPWSLAVPVNLVDSGHVKKSVKRCKACGQPQHAHPGTQCDRWEKSLVTPFDVSKSGNWYTRSEERINGAEGWRDMQIHRDLFFSVRLETLFKRLRFLGLSRDSDGKESPTPEDLAWVESAMRLLAK